jgi:hypothetical protein
MGPGTLTTWKPRRLLAKEGAHYAFEIYAPDFDYKVIKGMLSKEAIEKATQFVISITNFPTIA